MLRAMGHGVQLGLGLAALAEACQGAGQQARAAATAREATALLARAPGGPGRRHALDRLAAIARAGAPERAHLEQAQPEQAQPERAQPERAQPERAGGARAGQD
jgi:hypothetical protein